MRIEEDEEYVRLCAAIAALQPAKDPHQVWNVRATDLDSVIIERLEESRRARERAGREVYFIT